MELDIKTADRLASINKPSILEISSMLSLQYKSTNIAQGFPDSTPPKFLLDALAQTAYENEDQYTKVAGLPSLAEKLAVHYSDLYGFEVKQDQILISSGATNSLNNIIAAYCNPEDEIIAFDPFFNFYYGLSTIYGAKFVAVPLRLGGNGKLVFDKEELAKAFSEKTKAIIINTPHNPTGKVFSGEEFQVIAELLNKHPKVIAILDEAYDFLVYDGKKFNRFCLLPGMRERTFNVYSWGKTFNCTGWRLGVTVAPANLLKGAVSIQNWESFCGVRPIMKAWSKALDEAKKPYEGFPNYYDFVVAQYQKKKEFLVETIQKTKLDWEMIEPEGGYFIVADIQKVIPKVPMKYFFEKQDKEGLYGESSKELQESIEVPADEATYRWIMQEFGVTILPLSSFYSEYGKKKVSELENAHYLRLAICKSDATQTAARERLWKIDLTKGANA